MRSLLRKPLPTDDKYSRGVVGFATGSTEFPGAAILGVTGAMRTGVGMVRYLGPTEVSNLLIESRPEAVLGEGRAAAWVIGSGLPSGDPRIELALGFEGRKVVDAGALTIANLARLTEQDFVTPHLGEANRLGCATLGELTAVTKAVVVLKGSVTQVGQQGSEAAEIGPNPADLATAGTGDVLAGILGALIAANPDEDGLALASFAVQLHAEAGRVAAEAGPVVALDVAEAVREVVKSWSE
jgi:NAD(P)H-hydrate repair Nnr-like enzyme with NAD(P)H-hydrate dehydratase domain